MDGVNSSYVMEIPYSPKAVLDACSEMGKHPTNIRLGRLCNHDTMNTANLKTAQIFVGKEKDRIVVLKARCSIEPLTQLRYDYEDPVAQQMFNHT